MALPKTYGEMLKHIAELQTKAEAMRQHEIEGVVKRITEAMAVYGMTLDDLKAKPKKPVTPKPQKRSVAEHPLKGKVKRVKYRDKQGHTWAGGGSMPLWLKQHIEAGKSIDDFLVKEAA